MAYKYWVLYSATLWTIITLAQIRLEFHKLFFWLIRHKMLRLEIKKFLFTFYQQCLLPVPREYYKVQLNMNKFRVHSFLISYFPRFIYLRYTSLWQVFFFSKSARAETKYECSNLSTTKLVGQIKDSREPLHLGIHHLLNFDREICQLLWLKSKWKITRRK